MAEKFDQVKYNNDYNRQNYDRIGLMAPKGRKDEIKEAAKAAGMSLNEYILTAVAEKMGEHGMNENSACGGIWKEHRKKLFTPEEIIESNKRVEKMVEGNRDARPYDHIWDMYYDEFEDIEEE